MRQKYRKILAKEIIILFLATCLIVIFCSIYWVFNENRKDRLQTFNERLLVIKTKIDSIQEVFPRTLNFNNLKYDTDAVDDYGIPVRKLNKYAGSSNLDQLFSILKELKYPNSTIIENELISRSVNLDSIFITKPKLKKIYLFLKEKSNLNMNFETFFLTLREMPPIPKDDDWNKYEQYDQEKQEVEDEISHLNRTILSTYEMNNIFRNIAIIILILTYPARATVLTVTWAFKTLREER